MPAPPLVCSDNCGKFELLPNLIRVTVPLAVWPYREYKDGVIYEYKRREATRCVWERQAPVSNFWEIERLSRYEEGWNFPFSEPIADKWTWRFSLDRITNPIVLNGWSKDFNRFDIDTEDPDKNCESIQDLDNYVPLHPLPWLKARVDPILSVDEGRHPKRSIDPCFCTAECPLGSRPYQKYLVTTTGTPKLPGYDLGRLHEIIEPVGRFCAYDSIEGETPPAFTALDRRTTLPAPADHAYRWVLVLEVSVGDSKTFIGTFRWNEEDGIFPRIEARCDQVFLLAHPDTTTATLRPVPLWLCNDADARSWVSAHPLP